MDFETIKEQNQLAAVIGGLQLKRVASTGGGELAGPCPFCGGRDRFRVQPANNIWLCRNCTAGQWRDVIDFVAMRDHLTIGQAAQKLGTGLKVNQDQAAAPRKEQYAAYAPPSDDWQLQAQTAVMQCRENLFKPLGERALGYLQKRGFTPETLARFNIGYSPGYQSGELWIPKGITIPNEINGVLWYVKIRTNAKPKYVLVKGSKPAALFNANSLRAADNCLLTEGEFNAMIVDQEAGDLIAVASLGGSASNRIDLAAWGWYFMNKTLVLAVYDNDDAGNAGAASVYLQLGDRVKLALLPENQDLNAYHQAGGNVRDWIKSNLEFYCNA